MLHNRPLCMGIAHETANVYWTSTGLSSSIVKYDFKKDKRLYIADTGHSHIAKLDTASGTKSAKLVPTEPMGDDYKMDTAVIDDVVAASTALLASPSGLLIQNEYLYVSDNATGQRLAFTLDGTKVNYLDTGLGAGALGGMAFGPEGKLYFVDRTGNRVLRIDSTPVTK
jgi:hypothetical protein